MGVLFSTQRKKRVDCLIKSPDSVDVQISYSCEKATLALSTLSDRPLVGQNNFRFNDSWKTYGDDLQSIFLLANKHFDKLFYEHNLDLFKNLYEYSTDCVEHHFVIPPYLPSTQQTNDHIKVCLENTNKYREMYRHRRTELIVNIYKAVGLPDRIPFDIKNIIIQFLY